MGNTQTTQNFPSVPSSSKKMASAASASIKKKFSAASRITSVQNVEVAAGEESHDKEGRTFASYAQWSEVFT
jgi:hypothetical protein